MKRSLLRRMIVMFIAAFVLANFASGAWAPRAAFAGLGLQTTTLICNDGTNLPLTLDTAALTALANAVSAMTLYPAGDPALACGLSQPTSSSSGDPSGPHDYVVGGGQAVLLVSDCETNFSVSGHSAADAAQTIPQQGVGGTFNLTAPPDRCSSTGHLVSKVDCIAVGDSDVASGGAPGSAQLTAQVTHVDGIFASVFSVGSEIEVDLHDSGLPDGTGDSLEIFVPRPPCEFASYEPISPVDRGNITVHDDE